MSKKDAAEKEQYKMSIVQFRKRLYEEIDDFGKDNHNEYEVRKILITEVKNQPSVWDWNNMSTNRNSNQNDIWEMIGYKIYRHSGAVFSVASVQKIWKYLKEGYRRQLGRICSKQIPREEECHFITWPYYKDMDFLREVFLKNEKLRQKFNDIEKENQLKSPEISETLEDSAHALDISEEPIEPMSKRSKREGSVEEIKPLDTTVSSFATSLLYPPMEPSSSTDLQFNRTIDNSWMESISKPLEKWERDVDYITEEVKRVFESLKKDPKKQTEAKRKILNCIWSVE